MCIHTQPTNHLSTPGTLADAHLHSKAPFPPPSLIPAHIPEHAPHTIASAYACIIDVFHEFMRQRCTLVWLAQLGRAQVLPSLQDCEQAVEHNVTPASPIVGETAEALAGLKGTVCIVMFCILFVRFVTTSAISMTANAAASEIASLFRRELWQNAVKWMLSK